MGICVPESGSTTADADSTREVTCGSRLRALWSSSASAARRVVSGGIGTSGSRFRAEPLDLTSTDDETMRAQARVPGLRITPAAQVLAAAERATVALEGEEDGAGATPLPLPPPLGELPLGHGSRGTVASKIKESLIPISVTNDRYVSLDDVTVDRTVDSGEKARLLLQQRLERGPSSRRTQSFTNAVTVTTGAAVDALKKTAKVAMSRHPKSSKSMTAVELSESPTGTSGSDGPSNPSTTAAKDANKRIVSNPFVKVELPQPMLASRLSSDVDNSDGGIPSPRGAHHRSASGGAWSEVSYTTSDDGMLRMCHTSLAPTKPRRWTKGDNLGEGSYGSVWLALNGDTGELFALKEVRVGSSEKHRDESIEQLEQEVEMLSRLVHPNIVRYIGITREETALYIFLEYVPGGSIASLVQRFGKFEEPVIRVYTRQILIGLSYLHAQRVVHRDIKGANILVEKSGRIKLADFGMAKVLESVSHGKSFKGSACWMAPEVIRQRNVGFQADIWSVGCTVYEMATGAPPWSDCSTQVQIIFKIASSNEIPEIPEHLSPEGQDFLRLCLQRELELRPEALALLDEPFVLDAHRPGKQQNIPALQYDTWASSSVVSYRDDDWSVRSGELAVPDSRASSSRHVAWGDLDR